MLNKSQIFFIPVQNSDFKIPPSERKEMHNSCEINTADQIDRPQIDTYVDGYIT